MNPRPDPYSNPRGRAVDFILILTALLAIFLAVWTAPSHQTETGGAREPTTTVATR